MQKKLIALAVASLVSAPAFAQSNVQIYGVIDQALTSANSGAGSVTTLNGSGYTTERLGFQGSEDLGNGMKANFRLETGFASDSGMHDATAAAAGVNTGTFLWQREARVGLSSKSWGEVNFGRQYTPLFQNAQGPNDMFRVAGVGTNYSLTNTGMTRASNAIRYNSNSMNGFKMSAMYSFGDASNVNHQESTLAPKDLGRHVGVSVSYDNGPLSIDLGYGNQKAGVVVAPATSPVAVKATMLAGTYDFKMFKLYAGWQTWNNDTNPKSLDMRTWNIGGVIPVFGKDQIKLSYTRADNKLAGATNADSNLWAIGYVHPMSKRTTLYATYARMDNETGVARGLSGGAPAVTTSVGGANLGYDPNAFQIGVSHNF